MRVDHALSYSLFIIETRHSRAFFTQVFSCICTDLFRVLNQGIHGNQGRMGEVGCTCKIPGENQEVSLVLEIIRTKKSID